MNFHSKITVFKKGIATVCLCSGTGEKAAEGTPRVLPPYPPYPLQCERSCSLSTPPGHSVFLWPITVRHPLQRLAQK